MTLKLVWSGMFQGAFKHQVLEKGVDDVYYLKRADFQLPVPPLPTLEIPPEVIPDLREVYGIAADGTLYVHGKTDSEALVGERKVRTLAAVVYAEADELLMPVDHELGNPFYGDTSLSPTGEIVLVSNTPSFAMFSIEGEARDLWDFEVPEEGEPFWEIGAGDVACGREGFLVGGHPLGRVDHYSYDGKLHRSIQQFTLGGEPFDLQQLGVAKVDLAPDGRILISSSKHLFIFSAEGEIQQAYATKDIDLGGIPADFHLWMAVDARGLLWTQYYKGKEVAYAAFELPPGR